MLTTNEWIADSVSCYHYNRTYNQNIKSQLIDELVSSVKCIDLVPRKPNVVDLVSIDSDYSRVYKWSQSHKPLDNCNLHNYQFEELIIEDLRSSKGYFFKAKHIPSKSQVFIKFYFNQEKSESAELWYSDISRWMLKNRVLPNIDVCIDSNMKRLCNLSLETRFTKHLNPVPTFAYWHSTAYTGPTLHEYLDDPSLGVMNLFEVCKSLDICLDVWERIGLVHGQLTIDTVRIVKLNKMYRYSYEGVCVNTQYLPIPVAFDRMFVVEGSMLSDKACTVKSKSFGKRFDFNTFYLSLLYNLSASTHDVYKEMREYLIVSELAPLYMLNKEVDFGLQKLFQVDKSIAMFNQVVADVGTVSMSDDYECHYRLSDPKILPSSISADTLIQTYLKSTGKPKLSMLQRWSFYTVGTVVGGILLTSQLARVSEDIKTISNNTSKGSSYLTSTFDGLKSAASNIMKWTGLSQSTLEDSIKKLNSSKTEDEILASAKAVFNAYVDSFDTIINQARNVVNTDCAAYEKLSTDDRNKSEHSALVTRCRPYINLKEKYNELASSFNQPRISNVSIAKYLENILTTVTVPFLTSTLETKSFEDAVSSLSSKTFTKLALDSIVTCKNRPSDKSVKTTSVDEYIRLLEKTGDTESIPILDILPNMYSDIHTISIVYLANIITNLLGSPNNNLYTFVKNSQLPLTVTNLTAITTRNNSIFEIVINQLDSMISQYEKSRVSGNDDEKIVFQCVRDDLELANLRKQKNASKYTDVLAKRIQMLTDLKTSVDKLRLIVNRNVMTQADLDSLKQLTERQQDISKWYAAESYGMKISNFLRGIATPTNIALATTVSGLAALVYMNKDGIMKPRDVYDWMFEDNNLKVTHFPDQTIVNDVVIAIVENIPSVVFDRLPTVADKYSSNNQLTIDMIMRTPESRISVDPLTSGLGYEEFSLK